MATLQQRKFLEAIQAKATYWERICTLDPSAPECREYDV